MSKLSEHQEIDWADEDHLGHINEQITKFEVRRDKRASEANATERSLCTQLMLLGTVLVTVYGVMFAELGDDAAFSLIQRLLVIFGSGLVAVSILSGIRYYFIVLDSFTQWAKADNNTVGYISSRISQKGITNAMISKKVAELQALSNFNDQLWLRWQLAFLALAFLFLFVAMIAYAFDFGITRVIVAVGCYVPLGAQIC